MTIYNIPYDARTDPSAYFAKGFNNFAGEIMQGQQRGRISDFAQGMDPNANGMQIFQSALQAGLPTQVAMGMAGLQQRGQFGPSQMMAFERWNRYQQAKAGGDTETANRLLSSALVNFNVPTGEKLLTDPQRQEGAETDFKKKVMLNPAEKNLARKSAEEILKGTKARFWHWGTEDYTQNMMLENYKTWRAENSYDEQTTRKQKELDDLWDAKIGLWQKAGIKFDKDNIIGKNEIAWDPADPEVMNLRQGGGGMDRQDTAPTGEKAATKTKSPPPEYPNAVWNEQHQMWTIEENGRLMGVE